MRKPLLNRQKTQDMYAEWSQGNAGAIQIVASCIMLAPAIAAIIIAYQYNENSRCNDGTDYTIDLQTYLYVGGGIQMVLGGFGLLVQCYAWICSSPDTMVAYGMCMKVVQYATGGFGFAWLVIGFVMYDNQMSDDCHDERIAKMILAWCIYPFALCGTICCCAIFVAVCATCCGND